MWFREGREALEASSYCEYSREDVGAHKRVTAYLPNLSKTAHFSTPIKAENRPPFPRLQSRGPIEALVDSCSGLFRMVDFHGCKVVAPLKQLP